VWLMGAVARKSRSSSWRGHALIACVLGLALLLAGASWFATGAAAERERAEASRNHAIEVLQTASEIEIAALNAVRGERGFLLTDNPVFLQPMTDAVPRGRRLTAHLRHLVADSPQQAAHADLVEAEFNALVSRLEGIVALHRAGQRSAALERVKDGEGRAAIQAIVADLKQIERHENALLDRRSRLARDRARDSQLYQYLLTGIGLGLMVLAGFAVLAVRRAVAEEAKTRNELRRRAMTDELTGLTNRREFMASLERALAASRRNRRPLALAILDIDHFKRVNDTYGHPAGDAVIRTVAKMAIEVMRGQDTVGRLGGEEFAIVLPDCSVADAYAACERLRMAVRGSGVEVADGHNISVTLSTGIATYVSGDDAESMIARADAALYEAKHGGRDQVLLAA